MPPVRLYFDLSAEPRAKLADWYDLLERIGPHSRSAALVDCADDADIVIRTRASTYYDPRAPFQRLDFSYKNDDQPRHVVWDKQDNPTGLEPGLYCSLPAPLYSPDRHRTGPYPLTFNDQVEQFDLTEARHLLVFHGGLTHRVRHRAVRALKHDPRAIIRIEGSGGGLKRIRSRPDSRARFAESLRRAKFFLCPRGVGVGSIRLFETLRAARVPVIISDDYVLPTGIDWDACAIVVAEREIDQVLELVAEREEDWAAMAAAAYGEWSAHYADNVLLDTIAHNLQAVSGAPDIWSRLRVLHILGRAAYNEIFRRFRSLCG